MHLEPSGLAHRPRTPALAARKRRSVPALIVSVLALLASVTAPAGAYPGAPWFEPGKPYDQNFPDPAIIEVDGTYYAYATSTGGASLPVMTSTDLVTWTARGEALGVGPSWSPLDGPRHNQWAPSVVELPNGTFMAAFASRTGSGVRRCIATAYATSPLGPFHSTANAPFVCESDPNGAIDPFLVVDDNDVPWLIWKNEGVPVGYPGLSSRRTAFWSRQLTDDGRSWRPGSSNHFLLETTETVRPWQGTVIENPSMVAFDNSWFLFYSANEWSSSAYAMGAAVCEGPGGPCAELGTGPLTQTNTERWGPGAPAPVVGGDGFLHLGYQAWNPGYTNYPSFPACDADRDGECSDDGQRFLHIDRVCVTRSAAFLFDDDGRSFCDVPAGAFYAGAVAWLQTEEITSGVTATVYGADLPITRGQMATFLWRLMGEPSPATPATFSDVSPGLFYSDAVAWLADTGVTSGVTPTSFDPEGQVNRAQMATFLWRLMGSPTGTPAADFGDVPDGRYFSDAVAWLADTGVTTGTSPTTYAPEEAVTRAQMAAFLCRLSTTADYASSDATAARC